MGRELPAAHAQAVFSGNGGFCSQAVAITGTRTSGKVGQVRLQVEPSVKERASTHEEFIRRCIQLACHAKAQGNTAVGSVGVLDDKIVAEGVEQLPAGNILTGHAEVLACQQDIENHFNIATQYLKERSMPFSD